MKKNSWVFAGILVLALMSCDLGVGGTTTTTTIDATDNGTTTSTTTTTIDSTTTSTTIAPGSRYRVKKSVYTTTDFSPPPEKIMTKYTDTYHYPSATTNKMDYVDRVFNSSTTHYVIEYFRDSIDRIIKTDYYNVAVEPRTLAYFRKRIYNNDSARNYSQMMYFDNNNKLTSYYVYNYDDDGRLVGESRCYPGRSFPSWERLYYWDTTNQMVQCRETNYANDETATSTMFYVSEAYQNGNLINRKFYDNDAKTQASLKEEEIYIYDANGNRLEERYIDYESSVKTYETSYEYEYESY